MARSFDDMAPRAALVDIARDFHGRGWMAGTAGNLSCRVDERSFWITASGVPKGQMDERDFLLMGVSGDEVQERCRTDQRPSAETSIHQTLYRLFPEARACLHVHTVDACLAAAHAPGEVESLALPAIEMIKGLDIWDEAPAVGLPLFPNWAEVPQVAAEIQRRFASHPPPIPALMIRDHGVTVWGRSLQEAYNRVEVMEFLMSYLARCP